MFFTRYATAFLLSAAFVSAAPTAKRVDLEVDAHAQVKKHDLESEVQGVLSTLKATTDGVLPQITATVGNVSEDVITPLLQQVVDALNTATSALNAIEVPVSVGVTVNGDSAAQILGGVITDVSDTLAPVIDEVLAIPAVKELIQGTINPLLNTVLTTVNGLLPGVLPVVVGLVGNVTGVLSSLGLGSVVGTLKGL
ncbi:hypothetical protein BDZ89DRAFT_1070369 [Hymenopellis radicata]|nr:hypothetical protein BDZ89DRAFT_1070369 [Hymenopellis radicata]